MSLLPFSRLSFFLSLLPFTTTTTSNMIHQQSFQTLVGRYERVNGRVRDLVASAEVANAKLAAMQIRLDHFEEATDTELARVDTEMARVAAAPTNWVVETQYVYNLNM